MDNFIMLIASEKIKNLQNKEDLNKNDIDSLIEYLDGVEKTAAMSNVKLTDEHKSELKKLFADLYAKADSILSVNVTVLEEKSKSSDNIESYEFDDDSFDNEEIIDAEAVEIDSKLKNPLTAANVKISNAFENLNRIKLNKNNESKLKVKALKATIIASITKVFDDKVKKPLTAINIKKSKKVENLGKIKLDRNNNHRRKAIKMNVALAALTLAAIGTLATSIIISSTKTDSSKSDAIIENDLDKFNEKILLDKVEEVKNEREAKEKIEDVKKVLPDYLAFDVNDNEELVNRMSLFIVDIMSKGIPVKDFMTEEEIEKADENNVSFTTLRSLMDYYFVMNINEIDPSDYARLKYNAKTTDMIINNYKANANLFMDDLLTIKEDKVIDFTQIIADKESADVLQKLPNMIASLNDNKIKSKEISNYIEEEYVDEYIDTVSASANEQSYRFMSSFDELTNGLGISKRINIILNEDEMYSCSVAKAEGDKNKSEKAQDETDIRNIIEDKLNLVIKFNDQDTSNISEEELKTGYELENEIMDKVISLKPVYNEDPKFVAKEITTPSKPKSTSSTPSLTPSQVLGDNGQAIPNEELQLMGIDPSNPNAKALYEQAVIASTGTISDVTIDQQGNTVDDASAYSRGYADGSSDGASGKSKSPSESSTSYITAYNIAYYKALTERNNIINNTTIQSSTYFEDVTDQVVDTDESITTQDYTGDVPAATTSSTTSSSPTTTTTDTETPTTFESTSEDTVTVISEETTVEDYTSKAIKQLSDIKSYLISLNSKIDITDIDEINNIKQI